ncbi:MAG: M15 family metallopeptidase [Gemmatimonadota bacterium]|nr:M15 family metallopeptidase [Gemmatimonadota bacterium]
MQMTLQSSRALRRTLPALALVALASCRTALPAQASVNAQRTTNAPASPPQRWLGLIGEYGPDSAIRIVLERGGQLYLHVRDTLTDVSLAEQSSNRFELDDASRATVAFMRGSNDRATAMSVGALRLPRRQVGPESGNQLVITPVRPIAEIRREALAAMPPKEAGTLRPSDLVELTRLDPSIKLDIRYATSNNLFGTPFYTQARAFLQRPAAEALVRVSASVRPLGFGLLIHDGYRPWSVTKMFWDAAPDDKHIFVANPADGSKHNRGEAVDLSLYDLLTGAPVDMVSTYDETTDRAAARYPGGTSRQRWHRDLLRRAMEAERFAVIPAEWWHFDFADWRSYGIGNVPFEAIP